MRNADPPQSSCRRRFSSDLGVRRSVLTFDIERSVDRTSTEDIFVWRWRDQKWRSRLRRFIIHRKSRLFDHFVLIRPWNRDLPRFPPLLDVVKALPF
jgi:hypothetical protein